MAKTYPPKQAVCRKDMQKEIKQHRSLGNFPKGNTSPSSILGKQVDVEELKSHLAPMETHLPDQNHQEALEDTATDCLKSPRKAQLLARCPAPFKYCPGPPLRYKGDTQDLSSILGSTASQIQPTRKKQEALGHVEGKEDKVDVSGEGSILATPRIHANPEELKEAKMNVTTSRSSGTALAEKSGRMVTSSSVTDRSPTKFRKSLFTLCLPL
ncbi:uncharacterized protein VSU04_014266 [Chlamydotis macqueenii]